MKASASFHAHSSPFFPEGMKTHPNKETEGQAETFLLCSVPRVKPGPAHSPGRPLAEVNPENHRLISPGSRTQRHSKLCLLSPYLPEGAILARWPEAPAHTPATGSSPSPGSSQPLAAPPAMPACALQDASLQQALREDSPLSDPNSVTVESRGTAPRPRPTAS